MRLRTPKSRRQSVAPGHGPSGIATVVIGTDGSPTSWDAFSWGCGEARRMGGRVVAVFAGADETPEGRAIAADAERLLREAAGQGLDLIFVHAPGEPATELLRVADAVHADLLVVGKSTQVRHRFVGSMGQRLIARRPAPVVVVVP